jgi:hypothetical protein
MVMTAIIPGLREDFKSILDADKKRQSQIMQQYKDVFDRNNKALWTIDEYYDGGGIIAVLFPHYVITYQLAKAAKNASGPVLSSVATAGLGTLDSLTIGASSRLTDEIRNKFGLEEALFRKRLQMITEEEQVVNREDETKLSNILQNFGGDEKIMKMLASSSKVKKMQTDALKLIQQTSNDLAKKALENINKLSKIKSIDDVKRLSGGKLELDEDVSEEDIQRVLKDEIIPRLQQMIAGAFMKTITQYQNGLLKSAKTMNIENDPMLANIKKAIMGSSGYKQLERLSPD